MCFDCREISLEIQSPCVYTVLLVALLFIVRLQTAVSVTNMYITNIVALLFVLLESILVDE